MKELTSFKRWANSCLKGRGLLCHFYDIEGAKQKQYYTKSDYAYFNLFSSSQEWIVRGTPDHGIRSERGKASQVPVLNCYEIDEEFFKALKIHCDEAAKKHEMGIILNKRVLKSRFGKGNVMDIERWDFRDRRPPPQDCWKYDVFKKRSALWPFGHCQVVRVKIPSQSLYGLPIRGIPSAGVMALIVKGEGYDEEAMEEVLQRKRWGHVRVFPLL